ncbi:MAG: pyridoxal phosphate-dependent aminotransferase family protein, partial [Parachlamydiaceae bacterium]|nr:pyridoxal phosphate-dependent aminotransferase family protein [Parachlamydiaceae bacterium]
MTLLIEKRLQQRKHLGNLRNLQIVPYRIDFSSNDYLGLARSSQLATFIFEEWQMHL